MRAGAEQVLGDSLRLIHFPAMSVDEFTKIVVPAGLLDVDEENAVFRALLGAAAAAAADSSTHGGDGGSSQATTSNTRSVPAFPRNSRNFVTTRCDISYDGFMRHSAGSSSSMLRGGAMPQRNGWSLTVYCDHSIKVYYHGCTGTKATRLPWFITRRNYVGKTDMTLPWTESSA